MVNMVIYKMVLVHRKREEQTVNLQDGLFSVAFLVVVRDCSIPKSLVVNLGQRFNLDADEVLKRD